jgi:hypothetical protein
MYQAIYYYAFILLFVIAILFHLKTRYVSLTSFDPNGLQKIRIEISNLFHISHRFHYNNQPDQFLWFINVLVIITCSFSLAFINFTKSQAVTMLRESTVLNLIISRGAGSDFISPGESSGYNSAASSVNGDQSPLQNGKQKRLSVVREEMIDVIDERLLSIDHYITSESRRKNASFSFFLFGVRRGIVVGTATVDFRRRNDMEWNRHDHNDQETIHQDFHQWNRSSIVLEEQEERKRLQEERQRIQEAHKLLAEEKEKLARDRQQLEVCINVVS